ncbi:MAG: alginate export family protein [Deltaproteobacteria bacterium]|nr:alginate export family protein [Deltaproteobacteria bacterium]
MTLDLGSRRLVARNEFRNTINAFTGFHAEWRSPANDVVRAFVVRPVIRLPSDPAGLAEDRIELDPENVDALLWGAFYQSRPLARGLTLEAYALGLHERDGSLAPSANRELITPGARLLLPPARGAFDVQVELMGQLGRSRATTAAKDTTDLEHLAFSVHASVGHRFATRWSPRLVLQFDHASGDRSPNDGINGRFDPLFGARRWEFGPTGLYGAIPRSNVTTPGLRVEVEPHRKVDTFIAYRPVWLAAARDAWTSAGLRDTSGAAGTFVGHQLEGRVRWHIFPKNLVLDVGGAVFVRGEFAREAPGGESAPSLYAYSQVTGTM